MSKDIKINIRLERRLRDEAEAEFKSCHKTFTLI
jgi:hypothetical protein